MELRKDALKAQADTFLAGDGEMSALIRAKDWSNTPLGPIENWSQSLRMMASFLLANRFPLLLWWGPDYIQLYNDPYRPVLGTKHPLSMGQPARECWAEIWDVIGPLIDTPFKGGPATWMEDILLEINRYGFVEECHFTIAYSPVPDETASQGVGGVLATVHEITAKVVGERRVLILRDLGARVAEAKTAAEACAVAAETLAKHPQDLPFALLYLIAPDGERAHLAGAAGVGLGEPVSPLVVTLARESAGASSWPLAEVMRTETLQVVGNLDACFDAIPPGPWSDPPHTAVVVPIPSNKAHQVAGWLVAGVSSRLQLDEPYCSFLKLATSQIATAIANARAYEEERARAAALAEVDRAKTAFFSNVSHEFRTPLTLMLEPLEAALADAPARLEAHRGELDMAHRNALRLLKLVNSLLDFSRLEAGRAQACYEPTELGALSAELASNFRSACERAGLALIVDCPPLPEPVYVDRDLWEKILLNLLSNAFKFTFEGEIAVRLVAVDGAAELSVRDTGVGIPENELPRLFERFHRIEGQKSRTYEGSGIGLALVQELVRLHGGSIHAESALGRGTAFTVRLPFGRAHLPPERLGVERALASTSIRAQAYVEEALRWLPDTVGRSEVASASLAAPNDVPLERGAHILLADDNADMRGYVRRLLGAHYAVQTVADGEAALAAIRAQRPDLVLADVMMPRLDGVGLLRAIRADSELRDLPVVMLSARADEQARVEALQAGASDYLMKPFGTRELLARVAAQLTMAALQREIIRGGEFKRRMLESSQDCIKVLDLDGRLLSINDAGREHLEVYDLAALLNTSWLDLWREGNRKAAQEAMAKALTGDVGRFVGFAPTQAGTPKWWDVVVTPMRNAQGKPERLLVVSRDMTERKRAEEALRQSEGRLRAFFDSTAVGVAVLTPAGQLVQVNGAFCSITGYSPEELSSMDCAALTHPDDCARMRDLVGELLAGRTPSFTIEKRYYRKDGMLIWVQNSVSLARDTSGQPLHLIALCQDITERQRAEALQAAQTRALELIVEAAPLAQALNTLVRTIEAQSQSDMLGSILLLDSDGLHLRHGAAPHLPEKYIQAIDGLAIGPAVGSCGTAAYLKKPAYVCDIATDPRWTHYRDFALAHDLRACWSTPIFSGSGEVLGTFAMYYREVRQPTAADLKLVDIATRSASLIIERERTADALQEETRALAVINRIGRSLSAELDLERLVQAVTDAATELSGAAFGSFFYNVVDERGETYMLYTLSGAPRGAFADSPMPRNTVLFTPTFAGTGVVRLDDVHKDPRFGDNPPYYGMPPDHLPVRSYLAVPVISRSGEVLGGLFFGHPEPGVFTERAERMVNGIAAQAAIAIDNARLYQAAQREIAERTQIEQALRESERHLRTLSEGLEWQIEARTAELRHQAARLRRLAGKLTSAEQRERKRLAAILHDGLQQLLVAAKMRLGQARGQFRDPAILAMIGGVADLLSQAVDASRDLTRQLRPPVLYESGLIPALRWLAAELLRLHDLQVVIEAEDVEPALSDDFKALLFETVRELLFNVAKHAGVQEAAVRVRQDGDRLRIAVEDAGIGFDVEALAREEDPQQPGMGLFSTRERLAALGGSIVLESAPGEGTCIRLTVPLTEVEDKSAAVQATPLSQPVRPQADGPAIARQARVVVVDDHAIVREGIANVLSGDERLVVVGEAADGVEAIEAVAHHRPDVVLIDVNMPRMNGVEATREIRRRWPDVHIVALSVQDDAATARTMIRAGAAAFVSKSDDAGQMIEAVLALNPEGGRYCPPRA